MAAIQLGEVRRDFSGLFDKRRTRAMPRSCRIAAGKPNSQQSEGKPTRALIDAGIEVTRLSCEAVPTPHSMAYLGAKKERMGHALTLLAPPSWRQGEWSHDVVGPWPWRSNSSAEAAEVAGANAHHQ